MNCYLSKMTYAYTLGIVQFGGLPPPIRDDWLWTRKIDVAPGVMFHLSLLFGTSYPKALCYSRRSDEAYMRYESNHDCRDLIIFKNKIGEKEENYYDHDLEMLSELFVRVLESMKVLESRENTTLKKRAVSKPPSDDEDTKLPRKKSKKSSFDRIEGPSEPRGLLVTLRSCRQKAMTECRWMKQVVGKSVVVEHVVQGAVGDVTSSRPTGINEAVLMAYQLMGQIIQDKTGEVSEGEKRKGEGDRGGRGDNRRNYNRRQNQRRANA
ncbi:hypothetical protein Tco_0619412 [Tanacetum coccineum]